MNQTSIFTSDSFGALVQAAWGWLSQAQARRILIVAPSWGCADDFVRFSGGSIPVASFQRKTLLQLATELAIPVMAERGLSPVTGLGIEALCSRVIHSSVRDLELDYFSEVAETPGMSRCLARTLIELRLNEAVTPRLGEVGQAGRDLSLLARRFDDSLQRDRLLDPAGIYTLAVDQLNRSNRLPDGRMLMLYFVRPQYALEKQFLSHLLPRSTGTLALALEADSRTLATLQEVMRCRAVRKDSDPESPHGRLFRARRDLFSQDVQPLPEQSDDQSFEFFSAPGESRECVEIVRKIGVAAEAGQRFDRMAVALRNPATYIPLLEDAFRRAGIPAYFSRGTRRPDVAGRAFLALLECAFEGLSATRFAEYLSLAQVPQQGMEEKTNEAQPTVLEWVAPQSDQLCFRTVAEPESETEAESEADRIELLETPESELVAGGSVRTPARWEQLLVDAAVIGGRDRWEQRLEGLQREFEVRIKQLGQQDAHSIGHLEEELIRIRNLQSFALPLIDQLDRLPQEASWGTWIDRLEELAGRALDRPDSVLSVLGELKPMSQVEPVTLSEVTRVLRDRLTLLRQDPPSSRYGQVLVAGIEELWGRTLDIVFLPGLAEGIFPRKALEDPLLLDTHRKDLGIPLTLPRFRAEERTLLRVALAAPSHRLVVSYPRMDIAQGRSRVPSFYALDLLRAADGRLPDRGGLEKMAAQASSSRLGWPAPRDPQLAIDDAEFDLALLDPVLRLSPDQRRGRARFLLNANGHLARSLRARAGRWRRKFFPSDGLVDPTPSALQVLAGEGLRERSYSPTSLQQFAVCPYKFLLYAVHRLRPREEAGPLQHLDPLTRGSLFHEIQFRFFLQLRERGGLPLKPSEEESATLLLESVCTHIMAQYEEDLAPAIPRVWKSAMEELRTDLRGWLQEMFKGDLSWTPHRFELAFGLAPGSDDRDPDSSSQDVTVLNGVRLRGSIDLVERRVEADGTPALRVVDHKTGGIPLSVKRNRRLVVGGGEVLQPMLYGLAAEQLLEETVESGQLFYATRRGDFERRGVPIHAGTCAKFKQVLDTIERSIQSGFLPAAPRPQACRYCDYRPVCGPYEELRVRRKDEARLTDLQTMRELT